MAESCNISCTVMDFCKQTSTVSFDASLSFLNKIMSTNEANNLKKLIEDNSYGKVIRTTQAKVNSFDMPDKSFFQKIADLVNSKIGLDTVDQKAVLLFRIGATGKPVRLSLPAPKQDLFEYSQGQGLTVKVDKGEDFCTKFKAIIGVSSLQFVRGYHTGKQ
jgi:hypothetical protein